MKIRQRKAQDETKSQSHRQNHGNFYQLSIVRYAMHNMGQRIFHEANYLLHTQPLHINAPVDDCHSFVECDQNIRQRLAVRVVKVHGELRGRNAGGEDRVEHQRGGHCGLCVRKRGKMRDAEAIKRQGSDSVVKEVYCAKKQRKSDTKNANS